MAENNTEESTTKLVEDEMPSTSETSTEDRVASSDEKKNHEQTDIDKPSTSKEGLDIEKEKIEDINLLNPETQDASKTDCNGDLKEETNIDNTETSEMIESGAAVSVEFETTESEKKSSIDELNSEARSSDEEYVYTSSVQSNLNEILKIVHGDLAMEMLQHDGESATVKENSSKENNEEEQQTVKKKDDVSTDDTADSEKKCSSSTTAKAKRDSRGSSEKSEEKSNFGIVRSPTAIGELIEEQLANNSTLSTDRTDHIVEWVKNSVKANADEESNIIEECKSENTKKETEKRKNFNTTPPFVSPRKSQKLVSNIIKKSIKW